MKEAYEVLQVNVSFQKFFVSAWPELALTCELRIRLNLHASQRKFFAACPPNESEPKFCCLFQVPREDNPLLVFEV